MHPDILCKQAAPVYINAHLLNHCVNIQQYDKCASYNQYQLLCKHRITCTFNYLVENEILKSGMRFERLMNNSQRREARRAINGNTDSQCKMGAYYAEPDTKHTDIVEAVKWYKLSASQGNNKAQFELGMLYDKGRIKCDDYKEKAMECYMALAKAGFPSAQCTVGLKYRFGDGVEENLNEAIKWFKRSANQGHVDAQRNLGDIYAAIGKEPELRLLWEMIQGLLMHVRQVTYTLGRKKKPSLCIRSQKLVLKM